MTDFLTELIEERSEANEHFAKMVDAAFKRRELIRRLAEIRAELSISQTRLAALMGTSQSAVARLESGDLDVRASTLARYAAAVGRRIEFQIVEDSKPKTAPTSGSRRRTLASA
jgi:transcriptional regulator with XRE-family HTH domain